MPRIGRNIMEKPFRPGEARMLSLSDEDIQAAAEALIAGQLVAFPTETVYGLGADAFNSTALAKVFEAKGRPRFDPLIIHIADIHDMERVVDTGTLEPAMRKQVDAICYALWPGPLTIILPKVPAIPDLATAGLPTAAIRFPDHKAAQRLIRESTGAIAAPSANPFGYLSPTRAEHVREQLGNRVDFILDGGRTGIGVESTVIDFSSGPPRILRPGGMPRERIEAIIGPIELPGAEAPAPAGRAPLSPGLLNSHYAPRTPLTLHSQEEMSALPYRPSEAYLFFSGSVRTAWLQARGVIPPHPAYAQDTPNSSLVRALSEAGDLIEAAANLFDLLHELDRLPVSAIRAERAPDKGLGIAVNDRLSRAGRGGSA